MIKLYLDGEEIDLGRDNKSIRLYEYNDCRGLYYSRSFEIPLTSNNKKHFIKNNEVIEDKIYCEILYKDKIFTGCLIVEYYSYTTIEGIPYDVCVLFKQGLKELREQKLKDLGI